MPHRAMRAADCIVVDSPGAAGDARRIQPPSADDLRRVVPRRSAAGLLGPHSLARTAHHEAGHIVMYEWCGLVPTAAEIHDQGGSAAFDPKSAGSGIDRPDPTGQIAAMAAAILHAGLAAELLFENIDPGRVLVWRESDDTAKASAFLLDHFGPHSSGAHWYAQRLALHIVGERWERVTEIAAHLLEHGTWTNATACVPKSNDAD